MAWLDLSSSEKTQKTKIILFTEHTHARITLKSVINLNILTGTLCYLTPLTRRWPVENKQTNPHIRATLQLFLMWHIYALFGGGRLWKSESHVIAQAMWRIIRYMESEHFTTKKNIGDYIGQIPLLAIRSQMPEEQGSDHVTSSLVTFHWARRPHLILLCKHATFLPAVPNSAFLFWQRFCFPAV